MPATYSKIYFCLHVEGDDDCDSTEGENLQVLPQDDGQADQQPVPDMNAILPDENDGPQAQPVPAPNVMPGPRVLIPDLNAMPGMI